MTKKIFISYAWGDKQHQEWVKNLGTRLMDNTIEVELDLWSLKEGHDVHEFMESMVKANDIFRVLIICDKNYTEKADSRNGGVGTETQIITPAIYTDQKQEKFIPIVIERNEEGKPYLPIYLSSRKYIDFSDEENFESSYEELLRNILETPAIPKPKIGTKLPVYITESQTNNSTTSSLVRVLDNQLKKFPDKADSYFRDFTDNFLNSLWDFQLKSSSHLILTYGEELVNNLLEYKILRDDYIDCLFIVSKNEYHLDVDILINFFEKLPVYGKPKGEPDGTTLDYENYKIIFHELFLYTIAICLKNSNYKLVGDLLHSKYYIPEYHGSSLKPFRFTFLSKYHEVLEEYYHQKFNKITGFGHYMITNLNDKISKEEMTLADTLCYFIADLFQDEVPTDRWFPNTHLYKSEYGNFEFFERMSSKRHFDKVKSIFNVDSEFELQGLLAAYEKKKSGVSRMNYGRGAFNHIPFVHERIKKEEVGKHR